MATIFLPSLCTVCFQSQISPEGTPWRAASLIATRAFEYRVNRGRSRIALHYDNCVTPLATFKPIRQGVFLQEALFPELNLPLFGSFEGKEGGRKGVA